MTQKTEPNESESLYLPCQCISHMVEIKRFNFSIPSKGYTDEGFYLSMWLSSFNYKLIWRERFRWIWRILTTGIPWSDNVIINNEQAETLKKYIEEKLPKKD